MGLLFIIADIGNSWLKWLIVKCIRELSQDYEQSCCKKENTQIIRVNTKYNNEATVT